VFNLGLGKSQKESDAWTLLARALIEASISAGFKGVYKIENEINSSL